MHDNICKEIKKEQGVPCSICGSHNELTDSGVLDTCVKATKAGKVELIGRIRVVYWCPFLVRQDVDAD